MSRPVTRDLANTHNLELVEPQPSTSKQRKPRPTTTPMKGKSIPASSKASTVSHNKSNENYTIRSNTSSLQLRIREAELAATKRLASLERKELEAERIAKQKELDVERAVIQKELEVKVARLNASASHHSGSSLNSQSLVQEWLSTELHANQQHEPAAYSSPHHEERNRQTKRTEDLQFVTPQENRTRSDPKLSDIQILAREIANLRRPSEPKDLPYYNGNVSEWLSFKAAVDDLRTSLTDNELISKFRRCLKGEARITVAALLDTQVPASEIMEALELRFGLPELILQEEIQALIDMPRLADNTEQLSKFACKVRNCVSTIKALNKPEHFFNLELLRNLKQKMPHLKTRWISYAVEHELDKEPELVKLSNFLKREAQSTSKYWLHELPRSAQKPVHPNRIHYAEFEDDDSEPEPEPCYISNSLKDIAETNCLYCKSQSHLLKDCDQFLRLSIDHRWEWAKEAKICFKCLKSRHRRENCRARQCGVDGCRMSHNKLLHSQTCQRPETSACAHPSTSSTEPPSEPTDEKPILETAACSRSSSRTQVLLKVIPVEIRGPKATKRIFALLDGGSTLTLLKQELATEIGLRGNTEPFNLAGVNTIRGEPESERLDLEITGPSDVPVELYGVRTVKRLPLGSQTVTNIDEYEHLQDLPRTGLCYEHAIPELLIGQDNWHAIISRKIREGKRNEPVASLTALGWVVHGSSLSSKAVHFVGHTEEAMDKLIEDYFKIDSLGVTNKVKQNLEDERAIDILQRTAKRVEDGKRWEVGLLWRENDPVMPNSFAYASKRLQAVERKMDRDPAYGQKYKDNMDNFLRSGYAGPCEPIQSSMKWYLPHFGVTNINKPGKLRIVHDAASRVQGISLNDKLLTGPDLLLSLLAILFKFREGKIAVSADIKEMFLQIRIRTEDRAAQRFLWRDFDREGPMKEYEMKSVIFGATSSPATAIYVKDRNAEDFIEEYPDAVEAIKTRFYMDDYLHSFHSEETARKTVREVAHINQEGGFTLTQWISNNENVMEEIDESKRGSGGVNLDFNVNVKILGMRWNPSEDTLGFNINFSKLPSDIIDHSRKPTKREALKVVMSVFDPLGLLTPITIQGRVLLQSIWRSQIGWEQDVQEAEHLIWKRWIKRLTAACVCRVPRHYAPEPTLCVIELHIFCDASEKAYASVAYWRFVREDGKIWVTLITGKSRVTPLKPVSIPRLELQAALLGARLASAIEKEHETIQPSSRFFWTDSSAVVAWIKGDPRNYKTFVSNRLGEIAEHTKSNEWKWLPTSLNVADDATRDLDDLNLEQRWFKGPPFLYQDPKMWPAQNKDTKPIPADILEIKKQSFTVLPVDVYTPPLPDITRFSKWLRLIRSTAYIFAFLDNTRKKERASLKLEHVEHAKEAWIKHCQSQSFPVELDNLRNNKSFEKNSRLWNLCSFIDDHGVMRLRGRADAASAIDRNLTQPIILDGKHPYTKLLVLHHHEEANHQNNETVINSLRQNYWILNVRPTLRTAAKSCRLCRVRKAKPMHLPHGDLPAARLAHHLPPFSHCGLDYFGPMMVTIGRRHEKRYGALFTCMTSRAVHVELAASLSTDSVILALRRMIARRGSPKVIYSDNGTNFHGADSELKRSVMEINQELVKDFLLNKDIKWSFIPPASPHMGGSWERLIRSIKRALSITLKEQCPTEEVLRTLLTEAECIVNSRPLTHVSVRPEDPQAITPNHLLLAGARNLPHFGTFTERDMITRKQWRRAERLCDVFWNRWVREYLPTLLPRPHVHERPDLKEGDVVLIVDPGLPRNTWPKGRIMKVFPGPDGRVRVADVRTAGGVLRRPAVKIVRLPTDAECA